MKEFWFGGFLHKALGRPPGQEPKTGKPGCPMKGENINF